jgi:hypothetical protein
VIHAIDVPQLGLTDLAFTPALPLLLMLTAQTHSRLILRYENAGLASFRTLFTRTVSD